MIYEFNNIALDINQFEIKVNGRVEPIEPKVFDLIVYLLKNRERLVSRDEIFTHVWNGREVSDTSLSNHIKTARKTLGDSAEKQSIIKTVRGRGYQFIAVVTEINTTTNIQNTPFKTHSFNIPTRIITLLCIVILVTFLLFNYTQNNENSSLNDRLAVLPFKNLKTDTESDYLGFAIADQVIGKLVYINKLSVRPSGMVQKYQQKLVDINDIGEKLNVEYVLMGTYAIENGNIRLNIELINVTNSQLLWRESIVEKFSDIFNIQDIVAKRIAEYFKIRFYQQEMLNASSEKPVDSIAYRHYLRAIASPETLKGAQLAIESLRKSIEIAPNFAPNYVELAKRINFKNVFELGTHEQKDVSLGYFKKALTLNPNLRSAKSSLARFYAEIGETQKSITLSKELIDLNPNDAEAHYSLGYIYRYIGMLPESIRAIKKAIALDPQDEWFHNLAVSYIANNQFNEAIQSLSVGTPTAYSLAWTATIKLHTNNFKDALPILDKVISMNSGSFWTLDSTASKAIITNDYTTGLHALKQLEAVNMKDPEPLFYWAGLYSKLGDKQGSIRLLNQAVDNGYFNYPYFINNNFLDNVRNTDEFKIILKKVKRQHQLFKSNALKTNH